MRFLLSVLRARGLFRRPARRVRPRSERRRLEPAGLLLLLCASGPITAEDWHAAFFAEPGSGKRVTHYDIELPVGREERRAFDIPDDCALAMDAISSGAIFKGSIVDRRLWKKVESDCRYNNFLHRHPQQVIEDHVSGYDFMNAQLSDLPIDRRCAQSGTDPQSNRCNPAATDGFGILHHFPLGAPAATAPNGMECIQCALSNGLFRGYIFVDEDGIRCAIDEHAPSLRLIAVDFADINGDQILDAVLRLIPIGPGAIRAPLILPVTRLNADSPFSVPQPVVSRSPGLQ